jgi:SAM-dependent methyltransferase
MISRLAEIYYHMTCPDHPWLTKDANTILSCYLKKSDIGLEFGSGRGTVWFAKRVKHLTSIEHDELWYRKVQQMFDDSGIDNVDYYLLPEDTEEKEAIDSDYVKIIGTFESNSFDFVLVDGIYRDFCTLFVLDKIRPGGVLIIDNVNWYLPCKSYSPNSRDFSQGPKGEAWKQVEQSISDWRRIWTSSGVTDTAFFFKPLQLEDEQIEHSILGSERQSTTQGGLS